MSRWIRYFIALLWFTSNAVLANESTTNLRIISLTPSFTDIVVELDAANLLVGASTFDKGRLPILNKLDSVGNFGSYSLEKIISLKPDIILIWPSAINEIQQQQLKSLGIKIIEQDPKTLDDLTKDITVLGKEIGRTKESQELTKKMQQQLLTLKNKYKRDKPLTVFYQVWDNPIYTIGKQQIINDALQVCGAKNIFDDINLSAPQVNIETVLLRNPDAIVSSKQSILDTWKAWPTISAVKNNKLILFQDDRLVRPSLGMVESIKNLCKRLNNTTQEGATENTNKT